VKLYRRKKLIYSQERITMKGGGGNEIHAPCACDLVKYYHYQEAMETISSTIIHI
jgi:hypothetical protein